MPFPSASPSRPTWPETCLALVAGLCGLAWFHRTDLATGFAALTGDTGDTRLIGFLLEHSFRALNGLAPLLSPPMFHPHPGTFGYADAFLLHQVVYAPLRWLGLEPLTALQWTTILHNFMPLVTAWLFLRRGLSLRPMPALAGALLFAFNSAKFNQFVHLQLQPLVLLPLLAWGLLDLVRKAETLTPKQAFVRLSLLALGLHVQLLSGVYAGWFFAFSGLLFTVLACIPGDTRVFLRSRLTVLKRPLLPALVVFAVGALPFALLYGPVVRETGMRSYGDVQGMIPTWSSLLWLGEGNLAWSWLPEILPRLKTVPFWWEHTIGLGVVVTLCGLGVALAVLRAAWRQRGSLLHPTATPSQERLAALFFGALTLSVLAFYLLGMKYFGKSPWWFAFHTVPGAKAIRAVARYALVTALPLSVVLAVALDLALARIDAMAAQVKGQGADRRGRLRRDLGRLALCLLCGLAFFEQLGTRGGLDKAAETARIRTLAATIPRECKAFYVTAPTGSSKQPWELQIDAMWLALAAGVPTLNGYSGQDPPGWKLFFVADPAYRARVAEWIGTKGLAGPVCAVVVDR